MARRLLKPPPAGGEWANGTESRRGRQVRTGPLFSYVSTEDRIPKSHPLRQVSRRAAPACFETFPHAITWHLRGGNADARQKRLQRQALLEQAGINSAPLTSIDWIDAARCALAAHPLASGRPCRAYGEPAMGLILVPQGASGCGAPALE